MRVHVFCWLVLSASAAAQTAGPALTIDAAARRHAISEDIYGINDYSDQGRADELSLPVRRWGGDQATRYHWKFATYNAASDWYYQNFPFSNDTNQPDN